MCIFLYCRVPGILFRAFSEAQLDKCSPPPFFLLQMKQNNLAELMLKTSWRLTIYISVHVTSYVCMSFVSRVTPQPVPLVFSLFLQKNGVLTSSYEVLPPGCDMWYYTLDVQLSLRSEHVPRKRTMYQL